MIVTEKMWKEYKSDYEEEADITYDNIEEAASDLINRTRYGWSNEEAKDHILDDTNCDYKVMPDGKVFCSYFKAGE